jgi:hypothetical protein
LPRRFNVAGPCKPELHYMLPAAARVSQARRLVADFDYFVIHAPYQTGKTTSMIELAQQLTASGNYVAVLLSVEEGAALNDDPGATELAILSEWQRASEARLPPGLQPPVWPPAEAGARIARALQAWAQAAPRSTAHRPAHPHRSRRHPSRARHHDDARVMQATRCMGRWLGASM